MGLQHKDGTGNGEGSNILIYSALRKDIIDWCETDEPKFLVQVDTFIQQAERDIYAKVVTPDSRGSVTGSLSGSTLTMPTDFRAVLEFMITVSGETVNLLPKEVSFIREAYTSGTGQTRFYAILRQSILSGTTESTTLLLGPTPASTYAYEILYVRRPPSITATTTVTNTWLSDNAEDALLYHSLVHAAIFLKNYEVAKTHKAMAEEGLAKLRFNIEGLQKVDSYRNTELRSA